MLGIKKIDKIRDKTIKNKLKGNWNANFCIRRAKWNWAGHTARIKYDRWPYAVSFWFLRHLKMRRGKQQKR